MKAVSKRTRPVWMIIVALVITVTSWISSSTRAESLLTIAGQTVVHHTVSDMMEYRRPQTDERGARVKLFIVNRGEQQSVGPEFPLTFDGSTPVQLLESGAWAWHDSPSAWTNDTIELPKNTMTVWQFNTVRTSWGAGTRHLVNINGNESELILASPEVWISAVTFLGETVHPNQMIVHVANESEQSIQLKRARLWLPKSNDSWRVLHQGEWFDDIESFPTSGVIAASDRGGLIVGTGSLPLTYCAVEIEVERLDGSRESLWSHLRIRREVFDISGGWVGGDISGKQALTLEPYLKTLARMHVNTGHIADTGGYTDTELYDRYPLKYFNKLQPLSYYDRDEMLPRIHAVEFLGEPQYGGGRPVPPMEVWHELSVYHSSRLPTSVTHSEERIWRDYAGLSDFPHYDAYRITAPAADRWSNYDRWDGARIRWGAPLETIGEMTRNLRDLNRPLPIAYWCQGAHDGWGRYGGRERTSPTPEELRSQAYHAIAARIASLYWFNLSLKSLLKFPDLIEPIARVGREIRMIDDMILEGDAFEFRRALTEGKPDWELASIFGPNGGLLFALDTGYSADLVKKEFVFEQNRLGTFLFRLPGYMRNPTSVFRVDADGTHDCDFSVTDGAVEIKDSVSVVGIYVVANDSALRNALESEHDQLLLHEREIGFDPGNNPEDLAKLRELVE